LLADASHRLSHAEESAEAVTQALAAALKMGHRTYEAELYRLRGELLRAQNLSAGSDAEASFRRAIEAARRQTARSWELRAATSLARLQRNQGDRDEARALLAPLYAWFTEGFDTRDLKDAKALLEEL
jgi:predicted ATPase